MNITEMLMKGNVEEAQKREKGVFLSRNLGRIAKSDGPVKVEIRGVSPRRMQVIRSMILGKNGDIDAGKMFDANLVLITDGVTNPDLRNKDLQKKFGCNTPKDLAEKIFDNEVDALATKINDLSTPDEAEETDEDLVKN